ncbi:MAG: peptide ABC transporter ATP-binding protein, partial [Rhizobium oryzihabitans]
MEAGRIVEIGRTANIVSAPQSSTARTLIEAAPRLTITTQG